MVPEIGIEPTTYALRMRRSTSGAIPAKSREFYGVSECCASARIGCSDVSQVAALAAVTLPVPIGVSRPWSGDRQSACLVAIHSLTAHAYPGPGGAAGDVCCNPGRGTGARAVG